MITKNLKTLKAMSINHQAKNATEDNKFVKFLDPINLLSKAVNSAKQQKGGNLNSKSNGFTQILKCWKKIGISNFYTTGYWKVTPF